MKLGKEQAYQVLRQRLIGGHYVPGAHLREEPLAREFGLSRSPIRAALKRLVQDGLATADAGQGIHVSAWNDHDIDEIFQLRMQLEPMAAEFACERGGDALVARLTDCNSAMSVAIDRGDDAIEAIQEANRGFHLTLLEFSASPRLREFLATMIEMPVIIRSFHLSTRAERLQSLNHHLDVTRAAELRDGALGRLAMHLHLRSSYSRFLHHRSHWRGLSSGEGPAQTD